jgi:hypothetical protein
MPGDDPGDVEPQQAIHDVRWTILIDKVETIQKVLPTVLSRPSG